MSTQNFTLPDVGEGLTEAEIVAWKVAPGDTVAINDVVCEIETAKSLVELPSPHAGVVGELLVAEGTTVEVGTPIITFVTEPAAGAPVAAAPAAPAAEEGGGSVLVGYGTGGGATSRRKRPAERPVRSSVGVIAKPPIRKLARDLGVDLTAVAATGADGEVTRDDVMKHASQASVFRNIETPEWGTVREETVPAPQPAPAGLARGLTPTQPSAAGDDRTESIPVKGVRKATSSAMVQSAYSAPHVTVWKEIDASRTMELVKRLKASPDYADIRVSPLLIMARAVIWAARRTPMVNAAWIETEAGAEIAVRHYVNLGIAAATPRGLLVPNIKDAQDLGMKDLARALNRLTLTAREGKTPPA
ncbi:dihydrolipoamide acetyltransferase family protein, partial [uncultured Microbacterium sp.]